ncbi:virulence factor [Avibacterium avium]|uniref:virulence factor n=1 Tax=Avibacterium avium TaxID=751 RepID=UPI003BF8DEE3
MYAISFDLVVADTEENHPEGVTQAYTDIGTTLNRFGFERIQGSLYTNADENMANLFQAMEWFPYSVRDIRAFRIEQWSDFTPVIKEK